MLLKNWWIYLKRKFRFQGGIKITLGWTFIALFFIFLIYLLPRLIKISKIECGTQYGSCSEDMQLTMSNLLRSNNLQFTNLHKAKKEIGKLMKNYYYVSDFSTQFKIPSTLRVEILVKKPIFAIKQRDAQNFALVDKNGKILGISQSSSLPTVVIGYLIKGVGEDVEQEELLAMKLMAGVFSMFQINSGDIDGKSLLVEFPRGLRVIFPLGEDVDRDVLLGSLRVIYSEVMKDPDKYQEIDLRFRNPVLR